MKIGIVSLGGPSSKLLAKECKKYFDEVCELDLRKFDIRLINEKTVVRYLGEELKGFDCMYVRGSYRYAPLQAAITKHFSKTAYLPISSNAFSIGHDKFLTTLYLMDERVDVPQTYYAAGIKRAREIIEKVVSYPIILKVQSGTHGKGVLIAENVKTAKGILDILESFKQPFIIQEFVNTENTSDIRVIICGKKVMASYLRVACDGEFRSNVHAGGKRQSHKLTKEQEKLAIKSARVLGCDICGIDILNSKNPSVIEVNLSPSFHSVHEVTGVNAVWEVAKELYNQTIKFQAGKEIKLQKRLEKKKKKNGIKSKKKVEKEINEGSEINEKGKINEKNYKIAEKKVEKEINLSLE
jgi:ribosomal protein S6--L-glutamate ligase